MGVKKAKLLACKSVYGTYMNADIENHIRNCSTCLDFQQTLPEDKLIHHNILGKPLKV